MMKKIDVVSIENSIAYITGRVISVDWVCRIVGTNVIVVLYQTGCGSEISAMDAKAFAKGDVRLRDISKGEARIRDISLNSVFRVFGTNVIFVLYKTSCVAMDAKAFAKGDVRFMDVEKLYEREME